MQEVVLGVEWHMRWLWCVLATRYAGKAYVGLSIETLGRDRYGRLETFSNPK